MNRRLVLASFATGIAGALAGCSAFGETDDGMDWESIEELDIEIQNNEDLDVNISLAPDSATEPFQETTVNPGETRSFSPLPFDGERPEGAMLEIDIDIQQEPVGVFTTNEIIEFDEFSCESIQIDAVVENEQVTAETTCR